MFGIAQKGPLMGTCQWEYYVCNKVIWWIIAVRVNMTMSVFQAIDAEFQLILWGSQTSVYDCIIM